MNMTRHATFRSRQRNIPRDAIEAIYRFGTCRQSRGASSFILDREALADARESCTKQEYRELLRHARQYIVVGDAARVVTVARQKRRFRR